MELDLSKLGTQSSGFLPKFGSKETKSDTNSVQSLLEKAANLRLTNQTHKPKRTYKTPERNYFATCSVCDKKEEIRAFLLPVGWFSITHKLSGYILDQKLKQYKFCSVDCLKEYVNGI